MPAKFEDISKAIKQQDVAPVYFLHGPEPYFIDRLTDQFAHLLPEEQWGFNRIVLYGREARADVVAEQCRRYPIMADKMVVIIREAQEMKKAEELVPYLEHMVPSTVLVFAWKHKKVDKRTSFYKALKKHAVMYESAQIKEYKLPDWISKQVKTRGASISPQAAQLLADFTGSDLETLHHSIEKLLISGSSLIEPADIEENIGISKDYNLFELQKALGLKDVAKATLILNHFRANPKANPIYMIIPTLYGYFTKLFALEHKGATSGVMQSMRIQNWVKDEYLMAVQNYRGKTHMAISVLNDYDLRSKGIGTGGATESQLVDEMVYKLLYL